MAKKILILISEWGYWGEELIGPLEQFDAMGYESTFATPKGRRPTPLSTSMDPDFIDPPLGKSVTTREMAMKVKALDKSNRLDHPLSIEAWMPDRPYYCSPNFLREMEAYNNAVDRVQEDIAPYDAVFVVGGSGPIIDMANNHRVHDILLSFYKAGKPVTAICYGVACIAFARDFIERKSIIRGKHVTGHCKEYDYKDGTGFAGVDINIGPPPYPLEYILSDATAPGGQYHGNFGHEISVIVDYPFVTGRSTHDSYATGAKIVEVLEHGLKRYGW
jgi:putative intracellular protease/amidase